MNASADKPQLVERSTFMNYWPKLLNPASTISSDFVSHMYQKLHIFVLFEGPIKEHPIIPIKIIVLEAVMRFGGIRENGLRGSGKRDI